MIALLIWVLIFLILVYVVKLVLDALEVPPNIRKIVLLILGLIALVVLLGQLGLFGPGYVAYGPAVRVY